MKYTEGDIVVVTKRHGSNSAKVGHIGKLRRIEESTYIPYCLENEYNLYKWTYGVSWCEDIRMATSEDLKAAGIIVKEENYDIY